MRNCSLIALIIAVSLAANAETSPKSPLRAETLLSDINNRGPGAVVAGLRSDGSRWDEVMTHISHADRHWLDVAATLRPGTDAGASEALDEAVFLALKNEPTPVLELLKKGVFEPAVVCSSNIATDYSDTQSRKFINDRIAVLQRVSDPNTLAVRDQCLTGLRAALAEFGKSKNTP